MNRLKLRQKVKTLFLLLLSLLLLSGLIFTAVRTITPHGNFGVEAAQSDSKMFAMEDPASTSDVWTPTTLTKPTTGYGGTGSFSSMTDRAHGRTIQWSALKNASSKPGYFTTSNANAAATTGVTLNSSLRWTSGTGETVWWWDIVLDDDAQSKDRRIELQYCMLNLANSTAISTGTLFAFTYTSGTPGELNAKSDGSDGELLYKTSHYFYWALDSGRTYNTGFQFTRNALSPTSATTHADLRGVKFIRLGVYVNGTMTTDCPKFNTFNLSESGSYTVPTVYTTIDTVAKLQALRDAVNSGFTQTGKTFTLTQDLNLSGSSWTPIGQLTASNYEDAQWNGFAGTFDGQNHKITGFTQSGVYTTGLFGVITSSGKVKNLAIQGTTLNNTSGTTANGNGTFASWCFGKIENVVNFGVSVGSSSTKVVGTSGGIVGYLGSNGSITNAVNFGNIWYTANVTSGIAMSGISNDDSKRDGGGIVGVSAGGTMSYVANYGNVDGYESWAHVGGIVGSMYGGGSVSYAYNYGVLCSHPGDFAGGITAYGNGTAITIHHAYQGGSISGGSTSVNGAIVHTSKRPSGSSITNTADTKPTALSTVWSETDWAQDNAVNGGGVYLKVLHEMLVRDFNMVTLTKTLPTELEFKYGEYANEEKDHNSKVVPTITATWAPDSVRTIYTSGASSNALLPTYYTLAITKDGNTVDEIKESGTYTVTVSYKYGCYSFSGTDTFTVTVKPRVNYEIYTVEDLILLRDAVNKGEDQSDAQQEFRLMNDLDLSGENWTPIGALTESHYSSYNNASSVGFAGTFDGQGHKITGFHQSGVYATGLFGVIKTHGVVRNLAIEGASVNNGGDTKVSGNGVFASWCFGRIENVVNFGVSVGESATNRVRGSSGGIVGYLGSGGRIENAVNFGNIYAASNGVDRAEFVDDNHDLPDTDLNRYTIARTAAGGIVGVISNGAVENAANYGEVNINDYNARRGGIAGHIFNANSSIVYAYNYGNVSAINSSMKGGIVGKVSAEATIQYVYQGAEDAEQICADQNDATKGKNITNYSDEKVTELGDDFNSNQWAVDSGINAGGVYLKVLHTMLLDTFRMVTADVTFATENIGKVVNGTDWASGLKDSLISGETTWISDEVKAAYTQGAEPDYKKLVITLKGGEVDEIIDAGAYQLAISYGYGTHVFDDNEITLYNVKTNIETLDDLKLLRDAVNGGIDQNGVEFTLTDDLDMSSEDWRPIGELTVDNYVNAENVGFAGTFDGQNHKLTGFKQTANSNTLVTGLFGVIKSGGTVKNLAISGTTPLKNTDSDFANGNGVFAAWCFGMLQNVVNLGVDVGSTTARVRGASGGIVGYLGTGGLIQNAVNFGNVYFTQNNVSDTIVFPVANAKGFDGGGIVGVMANSMISNAANYGDVNGQGANGRAGGIAGGMYGDSGSIDYAYNYGAVYSAGNVACGIVAYRAGDTKNLDHVYQGGTAESGAGSSMTGAIAYDSGFTTTNSSATKPTALDDVWTEDKFGADLAIHQGGVYLKSLHDLLMTFGVFTVNVFAKNDGNVTENYSGTDYALGLAESRFTVTSGPTWISEAVRKAYTGYANAADVPYAKLIITLDGETVTEIIDVGTYSVTAVYSLGYDPSFETAEFTVTVNKATGSWNRTEGEYTGEAQAIVFDFGMDLSDGATLNYFYRLQSDAEFTAGLPVDAGIYIVRVEISGLDGDNFESGNSAETKYTVNPKTLNVTWTDAVDDVVTTTYNGEAQKPNYTYTGVLPQDEDGVEAQLVYALNGYLPGDLINECTVLLTLGFTGTRAFNYTASSNPVTFKIEKRVLNVSWEGLTDGKVVHVFDGNYVLPTPVFTDENGADATLFDGEYAAFQDEGNNWAEQGWRNATSADGVTLTLYIATGEGDMMALSSNYELRGVSEVVFVISPKPITGTWSDSTFEYNGNHQAPTFVFADGAIVEGDTVSQIYAFGEKEEGSENYSPIGAAPVNAGAYCVTLSLDGRNAGNYVVTESLIEQKFTITKKQYTMEIMPLNTLNTKVYANTVGTAQWKVNRKDMLPVTLVASVDITDPETPLTFSGDAGVFMKLYTVVENGKSVTYYNLRLPDDDNIPSVTFEVALDAQTARNYEYKEGETAPEAQTILLKRTLTYTLSDVEWTYGDGEKDDVSGYYTSTTRGNLEYSDQWAATVADNSVIPHYEFTRGTGSDANIEWMKLAIGKAGSTTITLTHPETERYLETTQTVTVTYTPKNVQFNARELRGNYGEKTYAHEDFLIMPTLAYEDTVENTFTIGSDYSIATMKNVKRGDSGEVEAYSVQVTVGANPNYTLNGASGDLTLTASLTILPKVLTVSAGTGYTANYAESLPDIALSYEGFIDGESIDNIKTLDPSFEAPTAKFPDPETGKTYLDAKRYEFELTGGYAKNYQFNLIGGVLTVLKGSLTGATGTSVHAPYIATAQTYTGTVSVTVPAGGTPVQDGYSYAVTGYFKNEVEVSPTNAGTYDVAITVYTTATDNYANYDTVLKGVFVIDPVTPYLNVTVIPDFIYNGTVQKGVSAESGLAGGTGTGEITYTYYYEDSLTPTDKPIHAGTYRVEVAYVPGLNDNYTEASDVAYYTIGKASMSIDFDTVNTPYDATAYEIKNLKIKGVGDIPSESIFESDVSDRVTVTVTYRQGGRLLTEAPKNAGMYTVEITATPNGTATYDDYEVTSRRQESAVVITQVPIAGILFEASKVNYDGTNKEPAVKPVAIGVDGDTPQGTFRYEYRRIGDSLYTSYARSAGEYDVKVTYNPTANDNYTAGDPVEFVGEAGNPFFEILRAPITIRLNPLDTYFTGERFPVSAILNSTVAGEEPKGEITYEYYYYENGEKISLGETAPRDARTYGVTVTYKAVDNDNFIGNSEDFNGYIVIRPIAPGITLVSAIHYFDGSPKGANEANLRGGAADQDGPKQTSLIYLYYVKGNWTSEYPTEVGRYNVNVRYIPAADEINYIETDRTFNEGVIINNRRPTIELEYKEVVYDGNGVLPNPAIIGDGESAKGVVMYEYAQGATWQVNIPVNVGTYSVRVIYRATADDNYASEVKEFDGALVIKPAELEITPVAGQYKIYDGLPISDIQFNRPQLAPGNLWQGELYAPGVDEGEYEISMGTLTAGKNYNIRFTSGVKYRIEKRTVYFNFSDINPVYDGNYKQVSVECEGVLAGENPLCTVTYEGDRMNVGTFTAIANVAGKNYQASVNNSHAYAITPATMGEIPFADSTVRYDGQPHSILVYAAPDGSKVTYESAHTFTEIGAYIVRAKVTKENYYDVELRATLVIQKGATRVSVSAPAESFRYGDSLPQLIAVGDPGIATLDEGQTLLPGERDYNWTFTPLDSTHYETVKGTITIRVIKATADISLKGSLRQEEDNIHALTTSAPNELQGEVRVEYIDSTGNVLRSVPTEAGNYIVRVTYAGDDFYEAVSYDKQLVITEKSSMMWLLYVVIGVVVLAVASGIFFNSKRKIK